MAKHKDATEVSIATTEPESELSVFVQRWWIPSIGVFVALGAYFLYTESQASADTETAYSSWAALNEVVDVDSPGLYARADPDSIARQAASDSSGVASPWARYVEASVRERSGDPEGAVAALAELAQDHPGHILNATIYPDGGGSWSTVELMSAAIQSQTKWESEHPSLFSNEAPPAGSPQVRIMTTEGSILVSLYKEAAPGHVSNFLKHCTEGFYNDTKFHLVFAGALIEGGDPNSKEADVSLWGQGGPGYKVPREENDLKHFSGYLAASKTGVEEESSGSQFYITTGGAHFYDGQRVIFGKVVEGMETAQIIESAAVVPGTYRPQTPAVITSTEVL